MGLFSRKTEYIDLHKKKYKIIDSVIGLHSSSEFNLKYVLREGGNNIKIQALFNIHGSMKFSKYPLDLNSNKQIDLVDANNLSDSSIQIILSLLVATRNGIEGERGYEYVQIYKALDNFINKKIDEHVDKGIDPMKYLEEFI